MWCILTQMLHDLCTQLSCRGDQYCILVLSIVGALVDSHSRHRHHTGHHGILAGRTRLMSASSTALAPGLSEHYVVAAVRVTSSSTISDSFATKANKTTASRPMFGHPRTSQVSTVEDGASSPMDEPHS